MEIDRTKQPTFRRFDKVEYPKAKLKRLKNDIPVYLVNAGTQDVIKIDLVFSAGSVFQSKKLTASITNDMLIEGTKKYSSVEISEKLDYYGAFIQQSVTKDYASVTLYSLKRFLPETFELLAEIIKNPVFPENELQIFINKKRQQFKVELSKVSTRSRIEFAKAVFGQDHPYGMSPEESDFDHISQKDLISFHKEYYKAERCFIIASGKIDQQTINLTDKYFGDLPKTSQIVVPDYSDFKETSKALLYSKKDDAIQSSIRIGKRLFSKTCPDYPKLNVVNTILGGFFGSRLMKSIREEKGYTYGIGSYIVPLRHSGYFMIATEVGASVTKPAREAILKEVRKLQTESVSPDEMKLVKNYMLGDLLRAFDGPFAVAAKYRSIIEYGLQEDYFENSLKIIKDINSDEILYLANKYLDADSMISVIAGKYDE